MTITLTLTDAERRAVLRALSEVLDGNARDLQELKKCGYSVADVKAMVRAEEKLTKGETS